MKATLKNKLKVDLYSRDTIHQSILFSLLIKKVMFKGKKEYIENLFYRSLGLLKFLNFLNTRILYNNTIFFLLWGVLKTKPSIDYAALFKRKKRKGGKSSKRNTPYLIIPKFITVLRDFKVSISWISIDITSSLDELKLDQNFLRSIIFILFDKDRFSKALEKKNQIWKIALKNRYKISHSWKKDNTI